MRKISSLSQSFRSVRKFFTSTGYSPTNSVNLDLSAGGYVKSFLTVSGVRKQPMLIPFTRRGGQLGGTPTIIDFFPSRASWSHMASAVIEVELANASLSYE